MDLASPSAQKLFFVMLFLSSADSLVRRFVSHSDWGWRMGIVLPFFFLLLYSSNFECVNKICNTY